MMEIFVAYSRNGVAVRAYSREKWAKDSLKPGEVCEAIPFDPPIERTYAVRAFLHDTHINWSANSTEEHHVTRKSSLHNPHKTGIGDLYYSWVVEATSSTEAIEKAKILFKESI